MPVGIEPCSCWICQGMRAIGTPLQELPFELMPVSIKHTFAPSNKGLDQSLGVMQSDVKIEFSEGGKSITITGTIKGKRADVEDWLERIRASLQAPTED